MGWVWVPIALLFLASRAPAQPQTDLLRQYLPGTKFEEGSLADILLRAQDESRLVVFYFRDEHDPATAEMERRVWRNPTLAAHVRWHSLAIKLEYAENAGLAAQLGVCPRDPPCVVVARVRHDKLERLAKMETMRNPLMEGIRANRGRTIGLQINEGNIPDIFPGTLKVLESTDTALEAVKARDPIWGEAHDRKNPEPKPPPDPDPIHEVDDDEAPAVHDPAPLKGTPDVAGRFDVYARLDEARAAATAGDLYLATGLYTWLWEKGESADPAFRAVKRSVLAQEMRDLAMKRHSSMARFRRLKTYYDQRLPWTTYERLSDWFLLNAVVGDEPETVAYLDLFVNDLDEGSMLPSCDRIAYRLLVTRRSWDDPWDLGEQPAPPPAQLGSDTRFKPVSIPVTTRAAQLLAPNAGGAGKDMDARDRKKIDDFRAVFPIDECARLHAACLRAGRDDDAWKIATLLLEAHNEPKVRHTLVAVALAAGQVRTRHLALLDEAAQAGEPNPILRERVTRALADAAAASALPAHKRE